MLLLMLAWLGRFFRRRGSADLAVSTADLAVSTAKAVLRPGIAFMALAGALVGAPAMDANHLVAAATAADPEPPRVLLDTTYVPPTGRTIPARTAGDFHAALKAAQPGDVISLQAGVTFTGNFTLPVKPGQGWIIIRSSTPDASLPPPGTRITPQSAGLLPKVVTPNADAALLTAPGAHHFRLIGLEIGIAAGVATNYGIVKLGDSSKAQSTPNSVPQDLIVDRCYIHGNATGDVSRGIALNSGRTAVIDSYVSECHGVGFDTQAICGWNGPGPFKIVNNYLEGAGENFMLGGADAAIPNLTPSDIEFRRNYLFKPLRWKTGDPTYATIHWSVKNLFELKNAQRVLIEGNVFENNWVDAQNGFSILFTPRNDEGGAPWSVVQDVTFTNNILRHAAGGINIHGRDDIHPSGQARRIKIKNNLFEDIGGGRWGNNGVFLQISDTPDTVVDHNTVSHTGNVITAHSAPSPNFVFSNNLMRHNEYGTIGDGSGVGNPTLNKYFPSAVFTKNVLVGGQKGSYPGGNYFPASLAEVGFTDRPNGNFRLIKTSPYKSAGTDGKDLGCDFDLLGQVTAGVSSAHP
jgi:hypothetical protein